jgi:hypothetical protein
VASWLECATGIGGFLVVLVGILSSAELFGRQRVLRRCCNSVHARKRVRGCAGGSFRAFGLGTVVRFCRKGVAFVIGFLWIFCCE